MNRRAFLRLVGKTLLGAGVSSGAAVGYAAKIEPHWPELVHVELPLPRLPRELDGFTIAQMSDMHLVSNPDLPNFTSPEDVRRGVNMINQLKPQMVVLTGDLFFGSAYFAQVCAQEVAALRAPFGVFAIMGNHERWIEPAEAEEPLREVGLQVLCNASQPVKVKNSELWVLGMDDLIWELGDLESTMEGVPEEAFKILLVHEPDFADEAAQHRIDLQLSGHSHGGQIRLPGIGPLVLPKMAEKYPMGLYQVDDMLLYTNRGLGVIRPTMRFNCRPEITLFRLRAT